MNSTLSRLDVPQHPFTWTDEVSAVRFHLDPALIVGNRQAFKQQVCDLIACGRSHVVLDLTQCGYIDASGLGVLVSIAKKLREAGGSLLLEHVNEDVRALFGYTKLDTIFAIAGAA